MTSLWQKLHVEVSVMGFSWDSYTDDDTHPCHQSYQTQAVHFNDLCIVAQNKNTS